MESWLVAKWQEIRNPQRIHVSKKKLLVHVRLEDYETGGIILIWLLAICVHSSTIETLGTAITMLTTARAHKIEST
jgi:hypothetical protein